MKTKTLIILLIILGVFAGAGALVIHLRDIPSPSGEMGAYLLEQLPANEVVSIVIERPTESVSLTRKENSWVVEERFGYPADFSKISDFVKTLKQVKVGRKFASSEKILKRLSLKSPGDTGAPEEERGTGIRMKDKEGKPILGMILGKTRTGGNERKAPDGQYVMLSKGPEVYLIDKILSSFEVGPSAWLEKSPVKVDDKEIRKISCMGPGGKAAVYTFERPGRGKDFELTAPSTDRKVKKTSLNRVSNALSSLQIGDVENPSTPPESIQKGISPRLDYYLFDGRVYRVYPGNACSAAAPCYLKLEVGYQKPGPAKKEKDDTAASEKKEPAAETPQEDLAAEAARQNDRLTPWVYTIPEWQHKAFITAFDQLLEKEDEKDKAAKAPVK
ncbi:MAG: DUF4340 domain-containing protein [Proteobacteria bacterium]|nr:DUF4340 domain-containing protein [Pseudomonadota bacterium]